VGTRHPNPRLAKTHRNYSVDDISRLFAVHKNTVRKWLKEGLPSIDDQRPTLVLGFELSKFLSARRASSKQSCGPGRLFCLPCRAPKSPAGKMVDCTRTGVKSGNLSGICPDCDRMIFRRVNLEKLESVRGDLEVSFTQQSKRIEEIESPSVNCHFSTKARDHEAA
jgi:hypothetical protein